MVGAELAVTIDGRTPLPLRDEGDGRYAASFPAGPGDHELAVIGEGFATGSAVHIGYPALLDFTRAHAGDLIAAADITGGAIVHGDTALDTGNVWRLRSEWRPWLVLALMLLLADLALRQASLPSRLSIRQVFRSGRSEPAA